MGDRKSGDQMGSGPNVLQPYIYHNKCGIQVMSETMTFLCLKENIDRRIQILMKGVGRSQIDLEHGNVKS